ncbi:ATP-dependent Zn protease [Oscillatoria sp. CS-180]|uniref:ATP-dependent Zn protease n=1 Tax=Oscillatoria sp. CS-180 TaxID=3021720 RepID=UPI00232DA3DA|nr:ATP-dependent Zn protease [Oscillatoria sp. CS-180]MDB9526713.1 ATP-dependent Zn protease [Oscillatoria sp. CS-180]
MSQTTLNTVAIAIFLVTMSVLLGPLLDIPQAFPAIAIVSVLGVAIIDQASWNGTLGNLFVNGFNRLSGDERERVLRHEAGHFLVAYLLDIPVVDYTLNAWDAWKKGMPGVGGVQFDTADLDTVLKTGQLPAQMLNRYCTVWMAGIAAEKMVYGQAQGGRDDLQKFSILWQQLQRPIQEGQVRQRWAVLQAQNLLEKHKEAYDELVNAMAEDAPVRDCLDLLASTMSSDATTPETQNDSGF